MAVTSVRLWQDDTKQVKGGAIQHTQVYRVVCDDPDDGTQVALFADDGATSIPPYNDEITIDSKTCKMKSKSAAPNGESLTVFDVTVNYTSESDDRPNEWENPLLQPTEYLWGGNEQQEPYFRDTDGNLAKNTAGDRFDPLPQRSTNVPTVTITRNESSFSAATDIANANTINSNSFTIDGQSIGAREALLAPIQRVKQRSDSGITYYRTTYSLRFRPDWRDYIENMGYRQKAASGSEPVDICDKDGNPVSVPMPLNEDGKVMAAGADPPNVELKPYVEQAFSFGF